MLRRLGLGLLVTIVLALLALNFVAWTGGLVEEESSPPQESVPTPPEPATGELALAPADDRRVSEQIARRRRVRASGSPRTPSAGSSTGKTLYAGTLASGRSLRFNRPKVWLRLGAASNVDIEINGRHSEIPPGTVELVLPDA